MRTVSTSKQFFDYLGFCVFLHMTKNVENFQTLMFWCWSVGFSLIIDTASVNLKVFRLQFDSDQGLEPTLIRMRKLVNARPSF